MITYDLTDGRVRKSLYRTCDACLEQFRILVPRDDEHKYRIRHTDGGHRVDRAEVYQVGTTTQTWDRSTWD